MGDETVSSDMFSMEQQIILCWGIDGLALGNLLLCSAMVKCSCRNVIIVYFSRHHSLFGALVFSHSISGVASCVGRIDSFRDLFFNPFRRIG